MAISLLTDTAATLDENLALDEALLLSAEAGESGEALRFWEWPKPAVVLGAGGSIAIDVDEEACRINGVSIHRRASGGGTVVLDRGCLLFSLVLSYERDAALRDVNASYRWILGKLRNALHNVAPIAMEGTSDLAVLSRKFSGNAQQRKARHVLHHGTLLFDFDVTLLERYLRRPEREPEYRQSRDHGMFVQNLPTMREELMRRIAMEFEAARGTVASEVWSRVPVLVADRYSREDWVRRR